MMVSWKMILLINLWAMVNVDGKCMSHTHSVLQQNEDTMKLSYDDESLQNNNQLNETKSNVKILQRGDNDSVNQFSNGSQYNIYYHTNQQHNLEILNSYSAATVNDNDNPFSTIATSRMPQHMVTTPGAKHDPHVASSVTDVINRSWQNNNNKLNSGNDYSTAEKQPASHNIGMNIAANSNGNIQSVNQFTNSNQYDYRYVENQQYHQILNRSSAATVNDNHNPFSTIATSGMPQHMVTTPEAKHDPHVVSSVTDVMDGSQQDKKVHLKGGNDDSTAQKHPASHNIGIYIDANSNVNIQSVNQVINSNQYDYRYVVNQQYHQFENGFPMTVKNVNGKTFRARFTTETPSHMVMTEKAVKQNKHVAHFATDTLDESLQNNKQHFQDRNDGSTRKEWSSTKNIVTHVDANGNHYTSPSINPVSDSVQYINHYYY